MKVVAQFSDRVRESNAFPGEVPQYGTTAWQIVVQDGVLSVSEDERFQSPFATYSNFIEFFAFTVVTELLVATLALRGWRKTGGVDLFKGLASVLLGNLLSYPVTWFFWPSLGQFQPDTSRKAGFFIAALAAICTALLVDVSLAEGRKRRRKVIINLLLLAIAIVISLVWLILVSYGNSRIAVHGLPVNLTILLAEVFAIAFEAALVYHLARKTLSLSLKQAALISLAMNLTSFLLGKWMLSGWL
jgi:hypothetical protein